jgi:hypothetical protein
MTALSIIEKVFSYKESWDEQKAKTEKPAL